MFEKMDLALIGAKMKMDDYVDRLLHEEKGASDIVAILVVIVILLAVAAIFKTQLSGLVEQVFGKATDWVDAN
ncbi:MAG: Flp1 family type IVb pilin [Lachnospiraceae bacterium]|nr:Flp1 family type IVb pilin [Lachnospiraceae bacterium]